MVNTMTFGQHIASTLIGTIAGFLFSIALFYLSVKWKKKETLKALSENLQREFDFNIRFLDKYKLDIDKMLRQITTDDKEIFTIFRFYKLQRFFIQAAFNEGLLYQYLTPEEITDLDTMLAYFATTTDQHSWNILGGFKNGTVLQKDALSHFEYDRDQIEKYIEVLQKLKEKLKEIK